MAILVTGGAGFIGSHLIERLLKDSDQRVVCLDNFNDYYDPNQKRENVAGFADSDRVKMIEANFCDPDNTKWLLSEHQVRHVVHLGAYAGVRYSVEHPSIYQHTNVCGTLNLLEAARYHAVERFVFASSSTVYGAGAAAPFREDAALGVPLSPYGDSKRAGELLCETYQLLHEVPCVRLRLFSVYGPRLRPDLAMTIFTRKIMNGEPLPLYGDGSIRRDFTHVEDICTGIQSALREKQAIGEAFNLGHDEPIEMRRMIELLEVEIGKAAQIDQQPEKPGDMPLTHANLEKAKQVLGYQASVPFEEGVKQFVQWHRDRDHS